MGLDPENAQEGQTPLEDYSGLIPDYVHTREALVRAEFSNNRKAAEKYLLRKPSARKAPFTFEWMRKVHAEMFGEVWEWAGKVRETELSIGVTAHKIGHEMHRLVMDVHKWESHKVPAIEIAGKLHHRLVWIHPFQGGNGRWARLLTDIYLKKNDEPLMLWPMDEGTIKKKFKPKYLTALRAADEENMGPLIQLHREYQNKG